jgi:phage terminase large subunit
MTTASLTTARVKLPPKLIPVFTGKARYRGAYGGRGSAKTRSFAKMAAIKGYQFAQEGRSGIILCGREYMNSLDESSMAEVKAAIQSEPWLAAFYDIGEKYIRTKCGRVAFKFAGLRRNLDSIKSKARILLLWVDEADPVSEEAWRKIIPTVREMGSEIWVTWNPEVKSSATHRRFRIDCAGDPEFKIVELNFRDNPWFPDVLEQERLRDKESRPDDYEHVWEGAFKTAYEGAYFAAQLTEAKAKGRIGRVAADPLLSIRAYCDIGGAGKKADAFTIWVCQFVGREIRVLDYYESIGQTLSFHVNWMRERAYEAATVYLPHDGVNTSNLTGKRYEDHWREAGFNVEVIPNQGAGAAMQRVEAVRRLFPSIWINETTCEGGIDALAAYHEKRDEDRNIGLGPCHDWSSHGADAFGLMCVAYEEPTEPSQWKNRRRASAGGWMGS